ncbi:MAG: S9 family peptidase [archaeon GBS-70-058]|mgnify:CR=1 FL=1|nr:S9 family peptidase [Candidatus Culexarchaeum nevadense]
MVRKFSVDDVLRLVSIGEVRVSCKRDLAFTISRNDLDKNKVLSEVHIVRSDGSRVFLVGEGDSRPRWSPSGSLLAFISRRGASEGERGVGVFVWSGFGDARRVAWFRYGVLALEWIDDSSIAVVTPSPIDGLYDSDEDYYATDRLPLWIDGVGYVAGLKYEIHILNVDSGYSRKIAEDDERIVDLAVGDGVLYYVAIESWRNPIFSRLVEVDIKSGSKKTILQGYHISSIRFIDGKLYGLMHRNEIGIASHYKLWVIEDGKPRCLTSGILDRNIYSIAGLVDGKLAFIYADSGSSILATIDDGRIRNIVGEGGYVHSAYAEANVIAYTYSTSTIPQELYLYVEGEHKKISRFNEWLLGEVSFSNPIREEISVDGEMVEGWIMLPKEGSGPYPVLLYIHGGPKGMYGYTFSPEMQLMVSEGFAVVYSNPRGSDGYSEEFADIRGRYGDVDYKQIMAFLDHVLSKYPLDGNRMAVTGISYGGYMTNVIVTKTDRFKAAVSENGIADWICDYWASDIGYWFDPDQIIGTPQENLKNYLEKSPAFYVDSVKTPMLFIHSAQDYRCFIDQSLAMHVSLVLRGKESKLIVFSKGSHGHSTRAEPRHRKKRYQMKIQWLKEKLKA